MRALHRLYCVGTVPRRTPRGSPTSARVFVEVEYRDGCLSLSGVEGPLRSGDAAGSCGQITLNPDEIQSTEGWTREKITRLAQIWERWHLNDMRPACEHQRAQWNPSEELEVVTYGLTSAAMREQREVERELLRRIQEEGRAEASDDLRALLALPLQTLQAPDADGPAAGRYQVDKRECRAAGWVHPHEHPRGLLGRPCGVCGYKYGSAWLREEVPADVLEFLASIPDTQEAYPWRRRSE